MQLMWNGFLVVKGIYRVLFFCDLGDYCFDIIKSSEFGYHFEFDDQQTNW